MKPIPTWRESLDTPENTISPNHIHASVEEVQGAMQAEIDALRQRVKELEDACDKFSEAEILLKDFDVRGHPA